MLPGAGRGADMQTDSQGHSQALWETKVCGRPSSWRRNVFSEPGGRRQRAQRVRWRGEPEGVSGVAEF